MMNDHTVAVQEANRNQAKGNEPTETRATTVCAATTGSTRNAGKKDAKGLVPNQPVSSVQRCRDYPKSPLRHQRDRKTL